MQMHYIGRSKVFVAATGLKGDAYRIYNSNQREFDYSTDLESKSGDDSRNDFEIDF